MKRLNVKAVTLILIFLLFGSSTYVFSNDLTRSIPLQGHGSLILKYPDSWKEVITQSGQNMPPTIKLTSDKENQFELLITPLWNKNSNKPFEEEQIKELLEKDGKEMLPSAAEPVLAIETFKGTNAAGYYFVLTDKAPKPNEFKFCYRMGIKVGSLLLSVTLLSNDKDSEDIKSAFAVLKKVIHFEE